jgi:hypothetical protein
VQRLLPRAPAAPVQRAGGLGSDAAVKELGEFIHGTEKLDDLAAYAAVIHSKVSEVLGRYGVPEVAIVAAPGDEDGTFSASDWRLTVNLNPRDIKDKHANIAETIVHELRHAQQAFQMARVLARAGIQAGQVAQELGVRGDVAARAAASIGPTPLTLDELLETEPWLRSHAYGRTVGRLQDQVAAMLAEATELAEAQPRVTNADLVRRMATHVAQLKLVKQQLYGHYARLPKEVDAREVANAVSDYISGLEEASEALDDELAQELARELAAELEQAASAPEPGTGAAPAPANSG